MSVIIEQTRHTKPIEVDKHSTAGEATTAYLRDQVDRLRAAALAVRAAEPDGVHDMRVAARRARSVLRAFRAVYAKADRARARRLRRELKWLTDVLGQARDTEVLGRRLTEEVDATPVELVLGPVSARIDRHLARDEADTRSGVLTTMDTPRYAALLTDLDGFLATPPTTGSAGRPATAVLPAMVRKADRRARRAARTATTTSGGDRDAALHRVRKAVKRARYAAEAATPAVGRPARRYGRRCRKVQRVLGDHHDSVALRAVLRDLGVQVHLDNANAFTFGLLHGRLGVRAFQLEHEFDRRWARLTTGKARRWLKT